jgi:hypothetical protein
MYSMLQKKVAKFSNNLQLKDPELDPESLFWILDPESQIRMKRI